MMSNEGLAELKREIQSLGYDEITAAKYAAWIGASPIFDQDDKVVVMDNRGEVVAQLKLKYFSEA